MTLLWLIAAVLCAVGGVVHHEPSLFTSAFVCLGVTSIIRAIKEGDDQ